MISEVLKLSMLYILFTAVSLLVHSSYYRENCSKFAFLHGVQSSKSYIYPIDSDILNLSGEKMTAVCY